MFMIFLFKKLVIEHLFIIILILIYLDMLIFIYYRYITIYIYYRITYLHLWVVVSQHQNNQHFLKYLLGSLILILQQKLNN
jgi:hypothetical protein